MSFFENTKKPQGLGGRLMVSAMNMGHRALADWGRSFLPELPGARVLDCGCGGGANLRALLERYPDGMVKGLDYSPVSVEKARKVNEQAIAEGRCAVLQGNVMDMIFAASWFDVVTAFETVYFWPELPRSFREVRRVLKPGGTFLICNECGGEREADEKWTEKIPGMTIYTAEELTGFLRQAGFTDIQAHRNGKGWLCVTARKGEA